MSEEAAPKVGEKQRFIRGSLLMTLSPTIALILGIVISILIDHYIPPDEYAIYEWYNVMYSFFITLIPLYLPSALSRYIAVAEGQGDEVSKEQLLKTSTLLCMTLVPFSGISAFLLTPLVFNIIGIGASYSALDSLIFSVGIMCINLSSFTESVVGAFQEFDKLGISKFVANILGQCTVIILIIFGVGIQALLSKFVITNVISAIFLTMVVKGIWSLRGSRYPLRPLLLYSYPSTISYLFGYFLNEILIRAIFQSYAVSGFANELGLYGFAVRIAAVVNALTMGFFQILGPYYAKAYGKGDKESLESELQWTLKVSFLIFLPLIVGAINIAPATFLILFPGAYYWSYQYFALLMFQLFIFLFSRPYYQVLGAVGHTKTRLVCSATASMIAAAAMILVADIGLIIAVIAYISNSFFEALFLIISTKKRVGIRLGIRQVIPLILIAFFTIGPAIIIHFLRLNPFFELILIICEFSLIYLLSIRLLGLVSKAEILKAIEFLPPRLAVPITSILVRIMVKETGDELLVSQE